MKVELPGYIKFIFVLIGIYLLITALTAGAGLLIPLAFSLLLALLLYPVSKWLEKRKVHRILAILISMASIIIILGGVFFVISTQFMGFVDELPTLVSRLQSVLTDFQEFIETRFGVDPDAQIAWINQNLSGFLQGGANVITSFIFRTSGFLTTLGLVPVYVFFMLYYRDLFKEFIFKATPDSNHAQVGEILSHVRRVIQHYLVGLSSVIAIIAVLNTSALLIIGVPHAVFFGVLAALLNVVPYIGVLIGSIIPVLYSLAMTGSIVQPLYIFLSFSAIQSLEGNLITPNITGSQVSINPLAAIVALITGGYIWGIAGMITFVPFVAMVKVIFDHVEPLKPYGLLLGVRSEKSFLKRTWERWVPGNSSKGS